VPFFRSPGTSDDHATTTDVLIEVLTEYDKRGQSFDLGCCIYPTAPFVTSESLLAGVHLLSEYPNVATVVPVVRFGYPIQRALQIVEDRLTMIWPENLNKRSQDLPPAYHDVGQFYWFRIREFLRERKLLGAHSAPIILPEWAAQDIDTEDDWVLAETKYEM